MTSETIRTYHVALEAEFKRQKAQPDPEAWAAFSAGLNRPYRDYMAGLDVNSPELDHAALAYQLWFEFHRFLTEGSMRLKYVRKIRAIIRGEEIANE